jgi:hypothetical protein
MPPETNQTTQPTSSPTFFGVDPTQISDPQGQTFYKAWTNAQQNPDSPLASSFIQGVKSGQYNDMAQAAGIDMTKYPQIFQSAPAANPDKQAEADINKGSSSFAVTGGDIPGADKVIQDIGQAAKETGEALNTPADPLSWITDALGGATNAVAGVATAVVDPLATAAGEKLRQVVGANTSDEIGQKLVDAANSPEGQKIIQTYTPAVKDVGAVGDVANLFGTVGLGEGAGEMVSQIAKLAGIPEIAQNLADNSGAGIKGVLQDHFVQAEKNDWARPSTVSKSTYSTPTDILKNAASKGTDIPDVIVKNGTKIAENVNGGQYDTADTAAKYRTDAGNMSKQLLRPSLQMADYSTHPTPVSEIKVPENIIQAQGRGVTPDDVEKIQGVIKDKLSSLENKYPDGMGLTDMHDNKITYSQNGKYSPVGDSSVDNNAIANRSIASVLGDMVEDKAPEGIPVHEFNAELQKQYQAADYLDSLDGKKVPQGLMQNLRSTFGKGVGALVGSHLGAGLLGDVAGYHIGGMVESTLEGLPESIRGHFLNNLKVTNPAAFEAVENYMGAETAAQGTRLGLPAAGESSFQAVGEQGGVIPMTGKDGISNAPYEGDKPTK